MTIAALLTCFNRKAKTAQCLKSLFRICPDCAVYLVDDGSADGTSEMVSQTFPQVHILQGSGDLFWSRGMYTAWRAAVQGDYDYYLWLNDDVELYPFFLEELMSCCRWGGEHCVVTGLIEDFVRTRILYGGADAQKRLLGQSEQPQEVRFMNGNVVLIPKAIVQQVGIIDPVFHHDLGDVDYGLSVQEHGFKVYTTRRAIAAGYENDFCRVRRWGVSLKARWQRLHSPLGSPPAINFYYRRKHFGLLNAAAYYIYLYAINLMPDGMVKALFGNTYTH